MQRRSVHLVALMIALILISSLSTGCGQKGDLYLPQTQAEEENREKE